MYDTIIDVKQDVPGSRSLVLVIRDLTLLGIPCKYSLPM
jgi:hypothetical protein